MKNDFQKMIERAVEIKVKYQKLESKPWRAEQAFMGMMKDIRELSKLIMVEEGWRTDSDKELQTALKHQLSDILFSISVIANKTGVNSEESFWETMDDSDKRLEK